jgi:predicted RNA-binding Zn-ribbon protein involved in translation (DUF1610 family)
MIDARQQTEKTRVVCARCGWRGTRSKTTVWSACPQCGARAELIVPVQQQQPHEERGGGRLQ